MMQCQEENKAKLNNHDVTGSTVERSSEIVVYGLRRISNCHLGNL